MIAANIVQENAATIAADIDTHNMNLRMSCIIMAIDEIRLLSKPIFSI